jgi:hypothetical protein
MFFAGMRFEAGAPGRGRNRQPSKKNEKGGTARSQASSDGNDGHAALCRRFSDTINIGLCKLGAWHFSYSNGSLPNILITVGVGILHAFGPVSVASLDLTAATQPILKMDWIFGRKKSHIYSLTRNGLAEHCD